MIFIFIIYLEKLYLKQKNEFFLMLSALWKSNYKYKINDEYEMQEKYPYYTYRHEKKKIIMRKYSVINY